MNPTPKHVAIIMDGNRRWAKSHDMPEYKGHEAGAKNIENICDAAIEFGISKLSLFVFSTENWNRSEIEISYIKKYILKSLSSSYVENYVIKNNIKVLVFGNIEKFGSKVASHAKNLSTISSNNSGLTLQLHINYGSKHFITECANNLAKQGFEINSLKLDDEIQKKGAGAVDLLIRTGNEQRLSNFLLWECCYAELLFSAKMWPDFDKNDFAQSLDNYAKRNRRYGS